jgi:hypothetical protein
MEPVEASAAGDVVGCCSIGALVADAVSVLEVVGVRMSDVAGRPTEGC